MATSGVYTYSMTVGDILTDAFESCGVLSHGEALEAEMLTIGLRKLNMLQKQWSGRNDFAAGLKMWTRRTGYLFLNTDTVRYSIGPSGDNATESFDTTTLSASAANGASSVTLTSATGFTTGDYIGVELDTGALHWTTCTMSGTTATLAANLSGAAASGNRVYSYTTKLMRPLVIETMNLRDSDSQDVPVRLVNLESYQAIADKASDGTPNEAYYEAQTTNGVLYVNRAPDDVTRYLVFVAHVPIQDATGVADSLDCTPEWFRAFSAQLAVDLCPPFGREPSQIMLALRTEAIQFAKEAYPQTADVGFEPYADGRP